MSYPATTGHSTPHSACMTQGCMASKITEMEQQAAELLRKARMTVAGQALWCDVGEHAFSDKAKGKETWSYTSEDEEGHPVEEVMLACPEHSRRATFQAQAREAARANKIAALETDLGIGDDKPQGIA